MRLIDADALVKRIENAYCKGCDNYNYVRCRACGTDDAINMIDESTVVDAIPVEWLRKLQQHMPESVEKLGVDAILMLWQNEKGEE